MLRSMVKGSGRVDLQGGQSKKPEHCGFGIPSSFKYRVEIWGEINPNTGFVIEVREIPRYFTAQYENTLSPLESCERIAGLACEYFAKKAHLASDVTVEIEANTNTVGFAAARWLMDSGTRTRKVTRINPA